MKQLFLFLLLLYVIKTAGSVEVNESSAAAGDPSTIVKYHGGIRYWTIVDLDGRTLVSLNALKDAVNGSAKLLFPKEKTMAQILSDLTLFSPTNAEDECKKDNTKFEFKLLFDSENWIRGEITVVGKLKIITMDLYAKCPDVDGTRYYVEKEIDENEANFVYTGRSCFQNEDVFQFYDDRRNVMEVQVSATFKCSVFLRLPEYMVVEDEVLPPDVREPMNSTFAAQSEDFWWKSGNDESLSDGISFVEHDVIVNISKSTKELPYFLRIGNNQPYPSLQFNLDPSCSHQQFDLFVNLRDNVDCRITVKLGQDGFQLTTKGGTSTSIRNGTKSPSFIFARGQSKVYVKDGLFIVPMEVCQIENAPDVPSDQFVLQIVPSDTSCALAQVILPAEDVKSKIEVLVDRVKAAERVGKANETSVSTSSTSATGIIDGETTAVAQAGSEWWWYVIAGVLSVILIVAAIIGTCYFVHRRRKQKEKERNKALAAAAAESKSKLNNDRKNEKLKPTQKTETTVPIEEPPKKTKKKKAKKEEGGKRKKKKRGTTEEESEKSTKKTEEEEKQNHYELLPPCPPTNGPPRSPGKLTSTVQATQEETTLGTGSTQNPTKQTGPGKPTLQTRTTQQPTFD